MTFKVVHISTSDTGGAGLAAYRLHKALLSQGIESRMLVSSKFFKEDEIVEAYPSSQMLYQAPKSWLARKIEKRLRLKGRHLTRAEAVQQKLNALHKQYPNVFFTSCVSTYDLASHPLVQEADVIHLHWVQDFLNYEDFFEKVNKPIVWTLHDLNPMFGGFHHVRLRETYYEAFKEVEDEFYGLKKKALAGKKNLSVVAISSQMHRLIAAHEFFSDKRIFDIFNSVDSEKFWLFDRQAVRSILGLPAQPKVLLFVNKDLNDSQKGLSLLVDALATMKRAGLLLVCVGEGNLPQHQSVEIRRFLPVNESIWLSQLYSAADCLVLPSYQEGFCQTPLEAMCCGTPVVMTPVSGSDDLIADFNGIRCDDFTVEALVRGIGTALERQYDREHIREDVVIRFGVDIIVKSYLQMYQQVLASVNQM